MTIKKNLKIFWDIDGTLIQTNGSAAKAFEYSASINLGLDVKIHRKKLSGFTDFEIAKVLIQNTNSKVNSLVIEKIIDDYCSVLPEFLKNGEVQCIGEITKVLNHLNSFKTVKLSLGTGNCLSGAQIKLKHAEILDFFDINDSFFSSIKNWSRQLIMQNAKKSLKPNQIGVVIGDSPKDIEIAKKIGLYVIGVATGAHDYEELKFLNPDSLLSKYWSLNELTYILENIAS